MNFSQVSLLSLMKQLVIMKIDFNKYIYKFQNQNDDKENSPPMPNPNPNTNVINKNF